LTPVSPTHCFVMTMGIIQILRKAVFRFFDPLLYLLVTQNHTNPHLFKTFRNVRSDPPPYWYSLKRYVK
jgi:hypothetical protein